MTPQEQQMIDGLIARIRSTQITDRDPVAADHLQQGLGGNPDALYILAQTVLVQQHSLEQAHAQMEQMEQKLDAAQQPAGNTIQAAPQQQQGSTWLSRFFGTDAPQGSPAYTQQPAPPPYNAPATAYQPVNAGAPPPPYGYAQQPYPPQGYAQQGYGSPFGQPTGMGGGGSFLRTAVQTAAGVAAGEMLFQGVESMFGGGHHSSNFGGGGETINNYYGDEHSGAEHHGAAADSSFYNPSDDASRGGTGGDAFTSSGHDNLTQNQEDTLDDNSYSADDSTDNSANDFADDSSADDGGSYDSGSSDDSN